MSSLKIVCRTPEYRHVFDFSADDAAKAGLADQLCFVLEVEADPDLVRLTMNIARGLCAGRLGTQHANADLVECAFIFQELSDFDERAFAHFCERLAATFVSRTDGLHALREAARKARPIKAAKLAAFATDALIDAQAAELVVLRWAEAGRDAPGALEARAAEVAQAEEALRKREAALAQRFRLLAGQEAALDQRERTLRALAERLRAAE